MANHQILDRLSLHEQKIAQLDELVSFREEFGTRIQALEDLIKEMHQDHQGRFRQVEDDLARTCQHLQSYVQEKIASPAAAKPSAPALALVKGAPEPETTKADDNDEPPLTLEEQFVDEEMTNGKAQVQEALSAFAEEQPLAEVPEVAAKQTPPAPPRRSLLARWFT